MASQIILGLYCFSLVRSVKHSYTYIKWLCKQQVCHERMRNFWPWVTNKHWAGKRRQERRSRRDIALPLEERGQSSLLPLHHHFFIFSYKISSVPHISCHCSLKYNALWKIQVIELIALDELPETFQISLFLYFIQLLCKGWLVSHSLFPCSCQDLSIWDIT